MPQAVNNIKRQQWQMCDQCGFFYPMGMLVKQKGQMHCVRSCYDNIQVERRTFMIEQVLGPAGVGPVPEGSDTRVIDRGFFDGFDETNR